jgi:hypothetical protein
MGEIVALDRDFFCNSTLRLRSDSRCWRSSLRRAAQSSKDKSPVSSVSCQRRIFASISFRANSTAFSSFSLLSSGALQISRPRCPYLRTQQASCDELKKAYDEEFRAGKEIIAAEFRTRAELNQPYVWKPPLISEVDMPARVVNDVMIPAHRELVIVRPGQWVRTESVLKAEGFHSSSPIQKP